MTKKKATTKKSTAEKSLDELLEEGTQGLSHDSDDSVEKIDMVHFESALNELETLVERMERGDQSLEDSIKDFEHGISLSKKCQISIEEAEQRVNQLLSKHGDYSPEPFHPNDDE
jgi:Exodeoxyribonuclease VII small subunit (EC 3.1.11.6)